MGDIFIILTFVVHARLVYLKDIRLFIHEIMKIDYDNFFLLKHLVSDVL